MNIRTLYLQTDLTINGHNALRGRILFDAFKSKSNECLLGHFLVTDPSLDKFDPQIATDAVSLEMLQRLEPNLLYVEGGLIDETGEWRAPKELLQNLVSDGMVLFVADVSRNAALRSKQFYETECSFMGACIADRRGSPVNLYDSQSCLDSGSNIFCYRDKMRISEWLSPAYKGVDRILAGGPVMVESSREILASGNRDTSGTMCNDIWIDKVYAAPFATVHRVGCGFVVFIAARVSDDWITKACTDNIKWLLQLSEFLAAEAITEGLRRTSRLRSSELLFLSHSSRNKDYVEQVGDAIRNQGIEVWIDKEEIVPSSSLSDSIIVGLSRMTNFVLFWSSESAQSTWVQMELDDAMQRESSENKSVIIVCIDQTPLPTHLIDRHYLNAKKPDDTLKSAEEVAREIFDTVRRLNATKGGL